KIRTVKTAKKATTKISSSKTTTACVTKRFRRWGGGARFERRTKQKKHKIKQQNKIKKKTNPQPTINKKHDPPNQNLLLTDPHTLKKK
ncbi:hypothetical protein, partial [Enterobacter asburiae]